MNRGVHLGVWLMAMLAGQLVFCSANSSESNLNSNGATTIKLVASAVSSPASPASGTPEATANGTKEVENASLTSTGDDSVVSAGPTETQSHRTQTTTSVVGLVTSQPSTSIKSVDAITEVESTVGTITENTSPKPVEEVAVTFTAAVHTNTGPAATSSFAKPALTDETFAPFTEDGSHETSTTSHITITPIDLKSSSADSAPLTISSTETQPATPPHHFEEQKLDNGLYRVKLAEIITDEFDNGLGDREELNSIPNRPPMLNQFKAQTYNNGKINIADLYPSKLEDFGPIIRESNEKLIKEKNLFTGSMSSDTTSDRLTGDGFGDDSYQQMNSVQSEEQQTNGNGALNSIGNNIPTTKIEIELIDEPASAKDEVKVIGVDIGSDDDGIIDLTAKLQENDGIISTIERDFLKVNDEKDAKDGLAEETTSSSTSAPVISNRPITTIEFIERRVKKHDPTFKNKFPNANGLKRADIGNTKFNGESGDSKAANEKPEFSTTKFYNSKELYNELMHENMSKSEAEIKTNEAVTSVPKGTVKPAVTTKTGGNAASTAAMLGSVKRVAIPATSASTTTDVPADVAPPKNANHQKILFFNVNGKPSSQQEEERLQKDRLQIIKDEENAQPKVVNKTKEINEQKQNMHLYIIHDDSVTAKASEKVNEKLATAAATEKAQPQQTTTTSVPSTASVPVSTVRSDDKTTTLPSSAPLAVAITNERPYSRRSRPRVLTHLQEKINSLDCDMQNAMPKDASVWRGNETHELNLPTTVSLIF